MTKKQFRTRLRLLIVLTLLLMGMIGFVAGKYIMTVPLESTVTFTASLATDMVIQEHTAKREADGSYTLVEPFVKWNTYHLIPGLDIPKDPHIVITGKTSIPAYLYITVTDTTGDAITYSLEDNWVRVDGSTNTYRYCTIDENGVKTPAQITEGQQLTQTFKILKNDKIYVSQNLLDDGNGETTLVFSARLEEVIP